MGIERLTIELDNPDGVYLPGQEVTGKVSIFNLSNKILKGLYFYPMYPLLNKKM